MGCELDRPRTSQDVFSTLLYDVVRLYFIFKLVLGHSMTYINTSGWLTTIVYRVPISPRISGDIFQHLRMVLGLNGTQNIVLRHFVALKYSWIVLGLNGTQHIVLRHLVVLKYILGCPRTEWGMKCLETS